MNFARKMKRKNQSLSAKDKKKIVKEQRKQEHVTRQMIIAGAKELKRMKDARVGVLLLYYIYVMYYELKAPLELLQKLPQYIDDIQWYLRYSYNDKGHVQQVPSFRLIDCCQQIRKEKQYWVKVRTSYDPKDDILCDIVKTEVNLECQLMWITVDKFPRFGKVKLQRLQDRIHEMEKTMTWEQQEELRKKVKDEINFTFDDCPKDVFNGWIWDESQERKIA